MLSVVVRTCQVSFVDAEGIKHTSTVQAESVYEAAVVGMRAITESWADQPGVMTPISIEVVNVVRHEVTLQKIRQWLNGTCRSPRERVLKDRLKEMIPG